VGGLVGGSDSLHSDNQKLESQHSNQYPTCIRMVWA